MRIESAEASSGCCPLNVIQFMPFQLSVIEPVAIVSHIHIRNVLFGIATSKHTHTHTKTPIQIHTFMQQYFNFINASAIHSY